MSEKNFWDRINPPQQGSYGGAQAAIQAMQQPIFDHAQAATNAGVPMRDYDYEAHKRREAEANARNWYNQNKPQRTDWNSWLQNRRSQINAQRQTALQQQLAQRNAAANAARSMLARPTAQSYNLGALQDITGVALNDALAGANSGGRVFLGADSTLLSNPQASGAGGVSAGDLGARNKASTGGLVSKSDDITSDRRDF